MPKDFLNGDFSFKNWFKIMWGNHYIQIFLVAFGVTIYELFRFNYCMNMIGENYSSDGFGGAAMTVAGLLICPAVSVIVAYKGFWQFWNDLKNGRSR